MTDSPSTTGKEILKTRARAYVHLLRAAGALLEQNSLSWTERLLLKLVRALYGRRLDQLLGLVPATLAADAQETREDNDRLQENMLEAAVAAALDGHELGSWTETDDGGYQAVCTRCEKSVYVSHKTMYSVLGPACTGAQDSAT